MVRILSASVWQAPGVHYEVVGDSCFLFGNQIDTAEVVGDKDSDFCRPVVVHSARSLTNAIEVPTERNLIKVWKEGFAIAEKINAELGVARWPLSRSSGVLCSFHPWKELLLNDTYAGRTTPRVAFDHNKLDKRELLKLIQQSCPLEFLRQHGLNGSEALILKKKNREAISTAYDSWLNQLTGSSTKSTDNPEDISPGIECKFKSVTYGKLLNTCKALLKGILCRAYKNNEVVCSMRSNGSKPTDPIGTLLLLHEDYPHELPVFTDTDFIRY